MSSEPLPMELQEDESGLDAFEDASDINTLLPPLPAGTRELKETAPVDGQSVGDPAAAVLKPAHLRSEPQLVLRPSRSYRAAESSRLGTRRMAREVQSPTRTAASRPTTAGEDESATRPQSRQSTRWREEWTPGSTAPEEPPPPPPLLSAERVALGTAAALSRFQAQGRGGGAEQRGVVARPPTVPGSSPEPSAPSSARQGGGGGNPEVGFEAALRRMSESKAALLAQPPALPRRASRPSRPNSAASVSAPRPPSSSPSPEPLRERGPHGDGVGDGNRAPAASVTPGGFSDLAMSFAAMDVLS